ncbi:hypothetical protein HWV62_12144 [Athelia sp. TMB]|nr:hypothetical protein HWV62_12144 [Athelia sp. TMB]
MSANEGVSADRLTALPSLSGGLSSLPQAKSMDSVLLYPGRCADRSAAAEAKLRKSLTKTASSFTLVTVTPPYMHPPPRDRSSSPPPLMMRKRVGTKVD